MPNPISATAGTTLNGIVKFEDPDKDSVDIAVFNYENKVPIDTNPEAHIVEAPFSIDVPAAGVTEDFLAEAIDSKDGLVSDYLTVTGEHPPIIADIIASNYGFFHDNDVETVETVLTDNTNSSYHNQYDTAKFYLDNILIGSTTAGGSVDVKDTSAIVGEDLEVKMELYNGTELVKTHIENNVDAWNREPTLQVSENYGTPNDGWLQGPSGDTFAYYLLKEDLDGDSLTLITDYGMVNPDNVEIIDFGDRYGCFVDSDGLGSGSYFLRHKVQDPHNAESDWEDITIRIN